MRLINTATLKLHDFPFGDVPPYAILSHTWGVDEVTFQEVSSNNHHQKHGFQKLVNACNLASQQGLGFVWVDTCCIDKSSSAELTEAINSMFQWYQKSSVCYAFIQDLDHDQSIDKLEHCRWVTRGWTLQELVAPLKVEFYDAGWNYRGSKIEHAAKLSRATGVPLDILTGDQQLQDCSVAARMSWMACRQTTRPEDIAYCMLGIFEVNMPLLYGEGLMAFRRLQEEILRRNNDMTILAWGRQPDKEPIGCTGVLATAPSDFLGSGSIAPFADDSDSISVTNKGLLISGDIPVRVVLSPEKQDHHYMVCLGQNSDREYCMEGLILRKIGPNTFHRIDVGCLPVSNPTLNENPAFYEELATLDYTDFYLQINPVYPHGRASRYREYGIHFPNDASMSISLVTPQTLWDYADRIFLRPKPYSWHNPIPQVLGLLINYDIHGHSVELAVFCDYERAQPKCGLYMRRNCPRKLEKAFHNCNIVNSILWPESEDNISERREGHPYVDVRLDARTIRLGITLKELRRPRGSQGLSSQRDSGPMVRPWCPLFAVEFNWQELY